MIRPSGPSDTDAMIEIWLKASRVAHDFVPYTFWLDRVSEMKEIYLPRAESWVFEAEGQVGGFLSLVDDYLAALFVHPDLRRRGYGRRLMQYAQQSRSSLTLSVYAKNEGAIGFYKAAGFKVVEDRLEPNAGEPELVMVWNRH